MVGPAPGSPHRLDPLRSVTIDAATKGFPAVGASVPVGDVVGLGWRLRDLQLPVMVIRDAALSHNVALMAAYCRRHGVELAPHGKTTMAPQLWARQLEAGAWGISTATVQQARVARAAGVRRILVANLLADRGSAEWVVGQLADPSVELICCVDSDEGVDLIEERIRDAPRKLDVLVELGHAGGRTGCRTVREAVALARRVAASPAVSLAGVTGYEGTVCRDRTAPCLDLVAAYLDEVRKLADAVLGEGLTDERDRPIVSVGGSAFFDLVVDRVRAGGARVILRSGCYLTHDSGLYERISPLAGEEAALRFRPAIEVWTSVLSRPEPELAILGMGRRDVPFDEGLPSPHSVWAASGGTVDARGMLVVEGLNDQHAYCHVPAGFRLEVGDMVGSGVSHPCTAFDKWRVIPLLDDDDRVVEAVATFF